MSGFLNAHIRPFAPVGLLLACSLFFVACNRQPAPTQKAPAPAIVAQVGDAVITAQEFEEELTRRSRTNPERYRTEAQREALLNEMIAFEVSYLRATEAGYEQRAELRERFRRMVVAQYEQEHAPKSAENVAVAPAEIESYYQQHQADWTIPEKYRPAILFLKVPSKASAEKKQEALAQAEKIRSQAAALKDPGFGDLARQFSDDQTTRYQGGDCGWISRDQRNLPWPDAVAGPMKALQPQEISPVISAPEGLYLVKMIERSAAGVQPLDRVRDQIAWKLRTAKIQSQQKTFAEQQRSGLRIVVNQAALQSVRTPESNVALKDAAPPVLPRR